jgi:predicted MFS family arabinose efflux permease
VNSYDPSSSGTTTLVDRPAGEAAVHGPGTTGMDGLPDPAVQAVPRRGLRTAIARPFLGVTASLGLDGKDSPRGLSWQALAEPRFRWYFAGSVVSNFGTWLQNTIQVVLTYQLTGSVFWVGVVTCAQFTSPLLLGPWAGVLTHRFGTWRMLLTTQCASLVIAATLAALRFTGRLNEHWLIIGAVLIGLAFTFALPALAVTVPTLVRPEQVKRALAMDSVSYNLGRALGPVIGVLLLATVGAGIAFAANAASFAFFIAVLVRQCPRKKPEPVSRSQVLAGVRFAWRGNRRILVLLLMVAAVTIAADPILVLGPALARSFGDSAYWTGVFITALGAGNVIGSLLPSRQRASIRRAASALCVLSVAMMVFVLSSVFWLSVAAALIAGMACLVAGTTLKTLLYHHSGVSLGTQAAVMAAWAVAWAGSKPIAALADGLLGSHVGLRATGLLLALPALLPAVVLVLFPAFGKRLVRHAAFGQAS